MVVPNAAPCAGEVSPGKAPGPETLADLMRAFNETTDRLRASHDALQQRVQALSLELEQKDRELGRQNRLAVLGEMAACLAHEIRNPLGGITLYAGLLVREAGAGESQRSLAAKIHAGVQHLGRLVEDILSYSGGVAPQLRTCDLHAVLEDSLALCADRVEERRIRIDRRLAPDPLRFAGDPALLQRVFLNILLNAVQAIEGEGRILLETAAADAAPDLPARVVVRISDSGPGLSAEARARLFTPFYTGRSKGTGLGLALAHRIVEGHRGTIRAENPAEGGARFVVELPRGKI